MHERALYIFLVFLSRLFFFYIFNENIRVKELFWRSAILVSLCYAVDARNEVEKREKKNETFTRTFDTRRQRLRLTENGLEAARGQ